MSGDFVVDTLNLIGELETYSSEYALSHDVGMGITILLQALESEFKS